MSGFGLVRRRVGSGTFLTDNARDVFDRMDQTSVGTHKSVPSFVEIIEGRLLARVDGSSFEPEQLGDLPADRGEAGVVPVADQLTALKVLDRLPGLAFEAQVVRRPGLVSALEAPLGGAGDGGKGGRNEQRGQAEEDPQRRGYRQYFPALPMELAGRDAAVHVDDRLLESADRAETEHVVIVNESFARLLGILRGQADARTTQHPGAERQGPGWMWSGA